MEPKDDDRFSKIAAPYAQNFEAAAQSVNQQQAQPQQPQGLQQQQLGGQQPVTPPQEQMTQQMVPQQ